MKILVTGAAGFVGSRLAAFLRKSDEVVGVDPRWGPQVNRQGIASQECGGEAFDVVYHLGGMIDVSTCETNPIGAWEANVVESVRLAQKVTTKRAFVYSTSYAALTPVNIYGKVKSETDFWLSKMNLPYASVMLPNVFGVGGSGVVSQFMFQKEPVIFGSGEQVREFIYIDDVVSTLIDIGLNPELGQHRLGGEKKTINAIADLLHRTIRHEKARPYEVEEVPDMQPTWFSSRSFLDGLKKMHSEAIEVGMTIYGVP